MKISVYITSFNQRDYLVEAIDSVLAQTRQPDELLILDDCSSDDSPEVIADYAARYPQMIRPIYHRQNTGIGLARVEALEAVTGDAVTHLDGDDRFLPDKLEREAAVLEQQPEVDLVFGNYHFIDAQGQRTGTWIEAEAPPSGDIFAAVFARRFPKALFRSEMVRVKRWREVGNYDPRLNLYEDYDMRIRLTRRLHAAYIDAPLCEYRRHDRGLSAARAADHLKALTYIYRKNRPLLCDLPPDVRADVCRAVETNLADFGVHAIERMLAAPATLRRTTLLGCLARVWQYDRSRVQKRWLRALWQRRPPNP